MQSPVPKPLNHELSARFLLRNLTDKTHPPTVSNYIRLAAHFQAAGLFDEALCCENLAQSRAANQTSRFKHRHSPDADIASRLISEAYRISASFAPRRGFRAFLHRNGLTPAELESLFYSRVGRTHSNYHLIGHLTQSDADF